VSIFDPLALFVLVLVAWAIFSEKDGGDIA